MIELLNMDTMEFFKTCPDKKYDLAVVDVPYGIGEDGSTNNTRSKLATSKNYKAYEGNDLLPPPSTYFTELKRVSKNQIIWGANHFIERIPNADSPCWIVWDKDNGETDFADCELAYTSFKTAVRKVKFRWQGMLQGDMKNKEERIHPNQKPIKLYQWIFDNYAQPGQSILDTHGGSFNSAIAAYYAKLNYTGIELSEHYFNLAKQRYEQITAQQQLF